MTTSRTPRARATSAPPRKPRAARPVPADPEPVEEATAADAQEVDADSGHYVTAALCDEPIRVIPPAAWRMSWQRQLTDGDIDSFLGNVLHPDDVAFVVEELDPTGTEFNQFLKDAGALAGEPMGKSPQRNGSSRPTRRR
jgi:hypothetical protein